MPLKTSRFFSFSANQKSPPLLALNFEYGNQFLNKRDSLYLNKHSETPKNSGNTIIILGKYFALVFSDQSQVFYLHNFGFDGNCRWRAVADQEKRSLFVSVFVFLEKNLSKTKISGFWPESPGFLEKKKVSMF